MRIKSTFDSLMLPFPPETPEQVKNDAWAICANFTAMQLCIRQFESAVRLADHAEAMYASNDKEFRAASDLERKTGHFSDLSAYWEASWVYGSWIEIAAREAALLLDQFEHLRRAISAGSTAIPLIAESVDRARLKEAGVLFRQHFPDAELIRDAVAHAAERASTEGAQKRMAYDGKLEAGGVSLAGRGFTISSQAGRTLSMSWKGKLVSVSVDEASLAKLHEAERMLFRAFDPVVAALRRNRLAGCGK